MIAYDKTKALDQTIIKHFQVDWQVIELQGSEVCITALHYILNPLLLV